MIDNVDHLKSEKLEKRNERSFIIYLIAIFTFNLGELIYVGTLKLSWLSAIVLIIILCFRLREINKHYKSTIIFLIWIIYAFLQLLFIGGLRTFSQSLISLYINIFVAYISLIFVNNVDKLQKSMIVVLLSILFNATIGLYEYSTKSNVRPLSHETFAGLPISVFGNPNDYATMMVLGIYLLILIRYRKKTNIFLHYSLMVFLCVMAYLSTSRLAIISIAILAVTNIVNSKVFDFENYRKKSFVINIVFLFLTFGFMYVSYNPETVIGILGLVGNKSDVYSDLTRLQILRDCFESFFKSFLLGTGAGTRSVTINPHHLFIEILAEYGIIWFIFVIIIILSIAKYIYKDKKMNIQIPAIILSFVFVSTISSSSFKMRPIWLFITFLFLNMKFEQENTAISENGVELNGE